MSSEFAADYDEVMSGQTLYMQQRYYDPIAGRFLSVDPVVADWDSGSSFNRYVYAQNNPYKYTDPDGRFAVDEGESPAAARRRECEAAPFCSPAYNSSGAASSGSANESSSSAPVQTITITGHRIAPTAAPSIKLSPLLLRPLAPWALLLMPSPLAAPACEMPGGPACGMMSDAFSPGFRPGDKGAEEWGRRNDVGAAEGRRRFHGIKQGDQGQGGGRGGDAYGVNPATGEVVNPQGEVIGELGGVKPK